MVYPTTDPFVLNTPDLLEQYLNTHVSPDATELDLRNTQITSLSEVKFPSNLKTLNLSQNKITI